MSTTTANCGTITVTDSTAGDYNYVIWFPVDEGSTITFYGSGTVLRPITSVTVNREGGRPEAPRGREPGAEGMPIPKPDMRAVERHASRMLEKLRPIGL